MDISKLLVSNTEVITNKSHNSNEKANRTASNAVVNNKKRHACTWLGCRKSFSRPSDMTRHYRIHTNDRPYQCSLSLCGKRFIQRSALTVHERTHSGEKPHICQYPSCNKSFGDSSSLARHRRIHTQARSYICDSLNCTKSYTKKSHLTRHVRRCHSTEEQDGADHKLNALYSPIVCNNASTDLNQDRNNYVPTEMKDPNSDFNSLISPSPSRSSTCNTVTSYFTALPYTSSSSRRSTTTTDDEDEEDQVLDQFAYHPSVIPTTSHHSHWSTAHYLCHSNHTSENSTTTLYQSSRCRANYI